VTGTYLPFGVGYVVPDVVVEYVEGKYEVRLEQSYIPNVRLSSLHRRLLEAGAVDPKIREYVRKFIIILVIIIILLCRLFEGFSIMIMRKKIINPCFSKHYSLLISVRRIKSY